MLRNLKFIFFVLDASISTIIISSAILFEKIFTVEIASPTTL